MANAPNGVIRRRNIHRQNTDPAESNETVSDFVVEKSTKYDTCIWRWRSKTIESWSWISVARNLNPGKSEADVFWSAVRKVLPDSCGF